MRAAVLNPPPGYLRQLRPLPDGLKIRSRPSKDLDFVQLFAANVAELRRLGPRAIRAAKPDGILWVAYPKGGKTKAVTDLPATPWWKQRDVLGEITGERGYRPVAFAKIDETWTTLRFRRVVPP
jgi:hypothetical protein